MTVTDALAAAAGSAEFVEAGLAGAPDEPVRLSGPLPGTAGFGFVFAPFADLTGRRLLAALDPMVGRSVRLIEITKEFTAATAAELGGLAARAMVLELQVARAEGRLAGTTPQARFRDFVAATGTRVGLNRLFAEYPLLALLIGRSCVNAVAAMAELLTRYAADRAELVDRLLAGRDPGPLVAVERTVGDAHRRGRRVAVLCFADGSRVVYKPRSLDADRHFGELVDWFNAHSGTPGLRTPALLTRPCYGWAEFVEARPCASRAELDRFYRRQGALLAVAHVLDLTDLHHENLIACGEHPVLVDVETLFHPPLPDGPAADDPAGLALEASVQRVGLLPRLVLGDEAALDLSGLGGGTDHRSPVESVGWEAAGTDEMRLVRRPGAARAGANRPRLDGADAEPAAHAEALVAGFRAGYRTVLTHRQRLAELLRRFAEDEVRVVTRATQVYATVLAEAAHPDALREPGDREGLLRLLGTDAVEDQGWPGLLDHEVAELWDGDVPVFTARPGHADLWSGTGARIPGALDQPGLDRVADRLAAMDEADRAAQERIMLTALACRTAEPAHPAAVPGPPAAGAGRAAGSGGPGEPPAPEQLLAAARELGDLLVEQAHRRRGRANWLGIELLGERYRRLGACGADLGHGYTGVALFLAQLAAVTGADRYAETARAALRPAPELLDRLAALPDEDLAAVGSGGFTGLGGILYALTQTAAALDDAELRALVTPAAALTVRAAGAEQPLGVLDGTAGGLAALLAAHRLRPSAELWRGASACADRLAAAPVPVVPAFATGAAGIGWALLGFAAAGGGARYRRTGLAMLRSAVAALPSAGADLSWCRGAAGVALAVADRDEAMAELELAGAVAEAVGRLSGAGRLPDRGLCHGEWGALELLRRPSTHSALQGRAAALARRGPRRVAAGGIAEPGLLTGVAGIGHGLLRLGFADRVPSALLLQSSTHDPSPARPACRAAVRLRDQPKRKATHS
ncbi:type 2 lanthipeptide synthetase LanM family protein [Streptacidiphilus sp. P02-A3a]|uniref:type 2 lanthipeptide synthetase LanM family protein n=1 Tax=Streptacidiphilus sp. P02-A3a TaxID=2704468 RepID=UPI0015FD7EE7|nr:type 2 lanthipeptide synthetase LanM family protein [Streptacidiphilus sp. P02-A3a]QMU71802.1 type 2 lantipeptide synthetase LanM [Streptacidiphilus sp. P02-A3a]